MNKLMSTNEEKSKNFDICRHKPLSEKKHNAIVDELKYGYYFHKDLKEALKELNKRCCNNTVCICEELIEIFGEELLE